MSSGDVLRRAGKGREGVRARLVRVFSPRPRRARRRILLRFSTHEAGTVAGGFPMVRSPKACLPACPSPCPVPPLYVAAAFLPHAFCVPSTHPGCFGLAFSRTLRPKEGGYGRGAWKKGCHAALLRAFSHFLVTSLDTVFCEAYVHKKRT